jgi:spectinomycin phosphotransferase
MMLDTTGDIRLIDCTAMMVAPREPDLWLLFYVGHQYPLDVDNTDVLAAYRRGVGQPVEPRPFVMELFRAEWHLMEISAYGQDFAGPHEEGADLAAHWRTLNRYLPVTQNWPRLALE